MNQEQREFASLPVPILVLVGNRQGHTFRIDRGRLIRRRRTGQKVGEGWAYIQLIKFIGMIICLKI